MPLLIACDEACSSTRCANGFWATHGPSAADRRLLPAVRVLDTVVVDELAGVSVGVLGSTLPGPAPTARRASRSQDWTALHVGGTGRLRPCVALADPIGSGCAAYPLRSEGAARPRTHRRRRRPRAGQPELVPPGRRSAGVAASAGHGWRPRRSRAGRPWRSARRSEAGERPGLPADLAINPRGSRDPRVAAEGRKGTGNSWRWWRQGVFPAAQVGSDGKPRRDPRARRQPKFVPRMVIEVPIASDNQVFYSRGSKIGTAS